MFKKYTSSKILLFDTFQSCIRNAIFAKNTLHWKNAIFQIKTDKELSEIKH